MRLHSSPMNHVRPPAFNKGDVIGDIIVTSDGFRRLIKDTARYQWAYETLCKCGTTAVQTQSQLHSKRKGITMSCCYDCSRIKTAELIKGKSENQQKQYMGLSDREVTAMAWR